MFPDTAAFGANNDTIRGDLGSTGLGGVERGTGQRQHLAARNVINGVLG
jgi:hypothetical protein